MSPSSKINAEEVDLLAALDRSALLEFAALLRLPPSSFIGQPNATASLPQPWLDAQRAAIETNLSPELLAAPKRGVKHTLGRLLGTTPGASSSDDNYTPPLCPSHAPLNPDLITHCLALLQSEISFRCDVLRSYVNRVRLPSPSPSSPHLTPDDQDTLAEIHRLRDLVHTLSGLATLWLRPAEFEAYFGAAAASGGYRFERLRSGCGACVLSVVGGRVEVLVALRANLLGREKRKVGRLGRLVEAWVERSGRWEEVRRVREKSERLAGEVKRVREWMEEFKVERRAREGKGVVGEKEKTGRSRHVGGMPEGTRVVEGMPMPRVRLDGEWERRRHGEDCDDRQNPFGGLDGMADFAQQQHPPGGPSETWSSSVSSSASADEADTDNNGEFVPARQYWPHSPRTTAQGTPVHESVYGASPSRGGLKDDRPSSALSTMLQPTVYAAGMDAADSESVPIFLDQSTSSHAPPPLTLPRRHRQSEQSTATNWEDLYGKGKGKGNKRQ